MQLSFPQARAGTLPCGATNDEWLATTTSSDTAMRSDFMARSFRELIGVCIAPPKALVSKYTEVYAFSLVPRENAGVESFAP